MKSYVRTLVLRWSWKNETEKYLKMYLVFWAEIYAKGDDKLDVLVVNCGVISEYVIKMVLVSFKNIDIWQSYGLMMTCMPDARMWAYVFWLHHFWDNWAEIFHGRSEKYYLYRLMVRNPSNNTHFRFFKSHFSQENGRGHQACP